MIFYDGVSDLVDEAERDGAEFAFAGGLVEIEFSFVLVENPVECGLVVVEGLLPEFRVALDEFVGVFCVFEFAED